MTLLSKDTQKREKKTCPDSATNLTYSVEFLITVLDIVIVNTKKNFLFSSSYIRLSFVLFLMLRKILRVNNLGTTFSLIYLIKSCRIDDFCVIYHCNQHLIDCEKLLK